MKPAGLFDPTGKAAIVIGGASAIGEAEAAVLLASDAASYVTGSIIFVDGGWLAADGRFTPPGM